MVLMTIQSFVFCDIMKPNEIKMKTRLTEVTDKSIIRLECQIVSTKCYGKGNISRVVSIVIIQIQAWAEQQHEM